MANPLITPLSLPPYKSLVDSGVVEREPSRLPPRTMEELQAAIAEENARFRRTSDAARESVQNLLAKHPTQH